MRLLVLESVSVTSHYNFIPTIASTRLAALITLILVAGSAFAPAQAPQPRDPDLCNAITDQRMRARCYETLKVFDNQAEGYRAELPGGWHLSRTQNANGGAELVSVMHAADFRKSDLNLAGILLQCVGGPIDVLIVVIQPYPPRAIIDVTLKFDDAAGSFHRGSVIPPGVLVHLPADVASSLLQRERSAKALSVQLVYEKKSETKGVVELAGFSEAIDALKSQCHAP